MSFYDPFQRYPRGQGPAQRRSAAYTQQPSQEPQRRPPTIEDYYQLVQAHETLQKAHEEVTKQLATSQEALRQQTKTAIDLKEEVRSLEQTLARTQAELNEHTSRSEEANGEWQERYLRLQAETDTYRRRLEQRSAAEVVQQRNQILEDMLSLADHLEMAIQHLDRADDGDASTSANASLRQNLQATLHAFLETLKKYGVQMIQPLGQPFDPQLHEALGHMHSDVPEDHVAAVVRTGYQVDDQLLRPARVMVSSGPDKAETQTQA